MNIEGTRNPINNNIFPPGPICCLPNEVALNIFSYLPSTDLAQASAVRFSWNRLIQQEIWKPQEQNVREDFVSFVKQDLLTWREAHCYSFLSNFVDRYIRQSSKWNFALNKDQKLNGMLTSERPKFSVRYGKYDFFICSIDIEVHKGESQPTLLSGENEKKIANLVVEGNHLFALREDGMIIQWDYKTGKQVQQIQTAFAKEKSEVREIFNTWKQRLGFDVFVYVGECLNIKNGKLIIIYKNASYLEIISYDNPEKSLLIKTPDDIGNPFYIFSQEEKVFVLGNKGGILIQDLSNNQQFVIKVNKKCYNELITRIIVDKQFLYAHSSENIYIINPKTKKQICIIDKSSFEIGIIDNLCFEYKDKSKNVDKFVVMNLNKNEIIKSIDFNHNFPAPDVSILIEECIKIIQAHRQPLDKEKFKSLFEQDS